MVPMNDKKIIAFVGMPGAGKGTCTDYLADTFGWPLLHFGNMMYAEVQRRGLDNVKDEKFVREDMRQKEGPAVIAKMIAREADKFLSEGKTRIVLDGLYSWSEYKYLREKYGDDLLVIAVAAPRKVRYQRILERKDSHRNYTDVQQIIDRETAEIENLEKGGPIANADYTIINDTTTEEMLAKLDAILENLSIK
jgi:dephospho-CoA kinase